MKKKILLTLICFAIVLCICVCAFAAVDSLKADLDLGIGVPENTNTLQYSEDVFCSGNGIDGDDKEYALAVMDFSEEYHEDLKGFVEQDAAYHIEVKISVDNMKTIIKYQGTVKTEDGSQNYEKSRTFDFVPKRYEKSSQG